MDHLTVRQAISSDIPDLVKLDRDYSSDHVWQMGVSRGPDEIGVVFREVRLPRPMRVNYPRDPARLPDEWTRLPALLVAEAGEARLGYLGMTLGPAADAGWVCDLVVGSLHRRQGVGTQLLAYARDWCRQRKLSALFLEMQSKNFPAISLARKLGFTYAGYSDRYYTDQDIALFFSTGV
jgi:ribosomal protein S18 acetylase RimI-like enzyme